MSQPRRVSLISLGCPKNLVDSEGMASGLLSNDFTLVVDPADADVVIVNTCGFLASARDESVATLKQMAALKQQGVRGLVVTGCMVGQYRDVILGAVPEVDRLVDFQDYRRLPEFIDELAPDADAPRRLLFKPGRHVQARLTPAHFAYLKISEGCNHTCTFCVIPKIRGAMRSVPIEDLVRRTERLVALGAKEINIVAQDSTMYGADLYGRYRLAELLHALDRIDGLRWIRLLYAYPTEIDDALLTALASGGKILPYVDVPLQHASDRILRAMKRRSGAAGVRDVCRKLRERVPGLTLRTTFIVGFPGETEADFEELLDFVRSHPIDRLGAFTYSPEPGSEAFGLPDAVADDVKADRLDRLMREQHGLALERQRRTIGQTIDVLIEDPRQNDGTAAGRSTADAPEIDGKVHVSGSRLHKAGDLVRARVERVDAYDRWATLEAESA